jgi:alkylhydroperoxidase/carboxymuconolactone decarboxylase family protein YurZ
MEDRFDKGLKLFGEIYGEGMAEGLVNYIEKDQSFGYEVARWSMEFPFGSVWTREGLERKMRSCVVLGIVIGLRQFEEIKYHTKMGIANGLTVTELEEIYYTAIPYAGFPVSNTAKSAILEALSELAAAKQDAPKKDGTE